MKVVVLELPQNGHEESMNQFTVLSEHNNGYSYEVGNFSVPFEREDLHKEMDSVLRKFKAKHSRLATQHMSKDNDAFKRVIDIALGSENIPGLKEVYERLLINIHKSKSPIERLIVTHTELLVVKEGQLFS